MKRAASSLVWRGAALLCEGFRACYNLWMSFVRIVHRSRGMPEGARLERCDRGGRWRDASLLLPPSFLSLHRRSEWCCIRSSFVHSCFTFTTAPFDRCLSSVCGAARLLPWPRALRCCSILCVRGVLCAAAVACTALHAWRGGPVARALFQRGRRLGVGPLLHDRDRHLAGWWLVQSIRIK